MATQTKIETIMLKKIMKFCPAAQSYEPDIRFTHIDKKVFLNLSLLPAELSLKIRQLFE